MNSGLLDPVIAGVVFAPLAVGLAAAGFCWRRAAAGGAAERRLLSGGLDRWGFLLGCVREALRPGSPEPRPVLGVLAVVLPLLALPFLYLAAAAMESLGGSPYTDSRWSNPGAVMALVKLLLILTLAAMASGLVLGPAGRLRREPIRVLSRLGVISSLGVIAYFLTVMHFLAGGE